jgi:hypothetical protein
MFLQRLSFWLILLKINAKATTEKEGKLFDLPTIDNVKKDNEVV